MKKRTPQRPNHAKITKKRIITPLTLNSRTKKNKKLEFNNRITKIFMTMIASSNKVKNLGNLKQVKTYI